MSRSHRFVLLRAFGCCGARTFFVKDEAIASAVFESERFEKVVMGNDIYGFVSILDGGDSEAWQHARANLGPFFRLGYTALQDRLTRLVEREVQGWRSGSSIDLMPRVLRLVLQLHLNVFYNYVPSEQELDTLFASSEYFVCVRGGVRALESRDGHWHWGGEGC